MNSANLDVLRATAVVLVAVFHVLLYFGYEYRNVGEFGVLLFFVHTTLVLMFSLERQQATWADKSRFWTFMVRRCFRIYPLSILVVSLSYVFHAPTASVVPHGMLAPVQTWQSFVADIALVQNVFTGVSQPGPLWSLPFEMQMYLVIPACFLLATKFRLRGAVALWLVVLAAGVIKPYFLLAFAPCFIPGVVAYCLWNRIRLPWQLWPPTLAIIICAYSLLAKHTFEGPRLTEWVACGAVAFTVPLFAEMPDSFVRSIAHLIAKYSFGIYLFHMACIWILFDIIKALLPFQIAGFVLLLSALSFAAYRYIEAPFIRLGQSLLDGKFGALLSIASSQSDS